MSELEVKKINNLVVKPLGGAGKKKDTRPVKGAEMFAEPYANIAIIARKKSGKTFVIGNILKECMGKDTVVIAFVSTLYKDDSWAAIQEYVESKGNIFIGYTSIWDTEVESRSKKGVDLLDLLVKDLSGKTEVEAEEEEEEQKGSGKENPLLDLFSTSSSVEEQSGGEKKLMRRPEKTISPSHIIIFDDLSDELKTKSLTSLLKKNRHFKMKVIVSTQYIHDLPPESLKQMDYWLLFGGQPEEKLKKVHKDADIHVSFPIFKKLYSLATADKYSFLYIDTRDNTFRKKFDQQLTVTKKK